MAGLGFDRKSTSVNSDFGRRSENSTTGLGVNRSTIIQKLSEVRSFAVLEGESSNSPVRWQGKSESAQLEILGAESDPVEATLLLSYAKTPTEHAQNSALLISLLNVLMPDWAGSMTWLMSAISSETVESHSLNGKKVTFTKPSPGMALLSVKSVSVVEELGSVESVIADLDAAIDALPINSDAPTEPLEPTNTFSANTFSDLRDLKLLLAEAILNEPVFESGIDLTESISLLQQAAEQADSNTSVMMTSLASVMSTNAVLKSTNTALSRQVAFKDEAIAKALMLLEKLVPD